MDNETLTPKEQTHEETGLGSVSCLFGHIWSPWIDRGASDMKHNGKIIGVVFMQERRCLACNKIKLRYEKLEA